MGIELVRVPKGWKHPTEGDYSRRSSSIAYQPPAGNKWRPLYMGRSWDEAMRDWWRKRISRRVLRAVFYWPSVLGFIDPPYYVAYKYDDEAPTSYDYRPRWKAGWRTHYQLYETVSEGTPISPVCATIADLIDWCVAHPNVWVGTENMTREGWQRFFARGGRAPTAMVTPTHGFESGIEAMSHV